MKCENCPHSICGERDNLSDICDGCTSDPDTGWGGFTDHSVNRHFNSNEEADKYYERYHNYDDEHDDNDDYEFIINY